MGHKKKVLFLFNATTHYYNLVLNQLNERTEYDISIGVPSQKDRNVGPGVFQTEDNLKIPIYHLEEKTSKYWGCYFPELLALLWQLRPDVILTLEYYQRGIFLNPAVYATVKLLNIKIIQKNIPFRMSNYKSPLDQLKTTTGRTQLSKKEILKHWRGFLGTYRDKLMFSKGFDAHVCYVKKAYEIYPTYGVDPKSIFITFNSPDTDLLMGLNEEAKKLEPILPPSPHRLIHVGRLVEWKRVDLILLAMQKLRKVYPDIELVVIGNGPMKEPWEKLAESLGLKNQVRFLGGVYDLLLLGRYFRASAIYVLGGMGGISINDAMCFERPILCSECDGTEVELVQDDYNGYFFENGNAHDLAEKIEKIFSNPASIERMGRNSYDLIKNKINIQTVVDGYVAAFDYATHSVVTRT